MQFGIANWYCSPLFFLQSDKIKLKIWKYAGSNWVTKSMPHNENEKFFSSSKCKASPNIVQKSEKQENNKKSVRNTIESRKMETYSCRMCTWYVLEKLAQSVKVDLVDEFGWWFDNINIIFYFPCWKNIFKKFIYCLIMTRFVTGKIKMPVRAKKKQAYMGKNDGKKTQLNKNKAAQWSSKNITWTQRKRNRSQKEKNIIEAIVDE